MRQAPKPPLFAYGKGVIAEERQASNVVGLLEAVAFPELGSPWMRFFLALIRGGHVHFRALQHTRAIIFRSAAPAFTWAFANGIAGMDARIFGTPPTNNGYALIKSTGRVAGHAANAQFPRGDMD